MAKLKVRAQLSSGKELWSRELDQGTYIIGRGDECDLLVSGERTSRRHAKLYWENNNWLMQDLESRHGMFSNGARIDRLVIKGGAVISIGDVFLRIQEQLSQQEILAMNNLSPDYSELKPVAPAVVDLPLYARVENSYIWWLMAIAGFFFGYQFFAYEDYSVMLDIALEFAMITFIGTIILAIISKLISKSYHWRLTLVIVPAFLLLYSSFEFVQDMVLLNHLDFVYFQVAGYLHASLTFLLFWIFWSKIVRSSVGATVIPLLLAFFVLWQTIRYEDHERRPPATLLLKAETPLQTSDFVRKIAGQ